MRYPTGSKPKQKCGLALHCPVKLLLMVDYTQHSAGCISQNLSCDKQWPLVDQERSTFKVKLVSLQAPPPKGMPMALGKMLNLRAVHSYTGLCQIVPLAFDQTLNQCHQPPHCCNCQQGQAKCPRQGFHKRCVVTPTKSAQARPIGSDQMSYSCCVYLIA